MGKELELKLSLHPKWADALRDSIWLAERAIEPVTGFQLNNTYFDTPDKQLQQQKAAVRIRRQGNQWLQTLKTKGQAVQGLHERLEWEWPLDEPQLDMGLLASTGVALDWQALALMPRFTTDFHRSRWLVEQQQSLIEVVLDQGGIKAGTGQEDICEVELELKQGKAEDLFLFAEQLADHFPLMPSDISKAERGERLAVQGPLVAPQLPQLSSRSRAEVHKHWLKYWQQRISFLWHRFISGRDYSALCDMESALQAVLYLQQQPGLPAPMELQPAHKWLTEYQQILHQWTEIMNTVNGIRLDEHTEGKGITQRLMQLQQGPMEHALNQVCDSTLLGRWSLGLSRWLRHSNTDHSATLTDVQLAGPVLEGIQSLSSDEPLGVASWLQRMPGIKSALQWAEQWQCLAYQPADTLSSMITCLSAIDRRLQVLEAMQLSDAYWQGRLGDSDKNKLRSWCRRDTVILRELQQLADELQHHQQRLKTQWADGQVSVELSEQEQ